MIDKAAEGDIDIRDNIDLIKKLCGLKYKEVLRETIQEYQRKGNFIRIYPAKGTDCYDVYFA